MNNLVCTGNDLNNALNQVLATLRDTVISTFGPNGKLVIIDVPGSHVPLVTKDGVTVAEHLHSDVLQEEMLLSLIKESARRTAIEQGDGTTTATLLAVSLIEYLSARTVSKDVIDGMLHALNFVYQYLEDVNIECKHNESALLSVINISCNGDKDIVRLLTQVIKEVGADGIINVDLTEEQKTTVDYNDGATMTTAATIPASKEKLWEREDVKVLLVEGKIEYMHQIANALNKITDLGKQAKRSVPLPLIIVAQDFSEEVKHAITVNNSRGATDIALIDAEGFGKTRLDILEDIALISDSNIVSTNGSTSYRLLDFTISELGDFDKVIVTERETTLYPNEELNISTREIRESELRDEYKRLKDTPLTTLASDLANVERHLSKFAKVATIRVGGYSKAETSERKDRMDDAICAVVSAHNGGVLPGGGASLCRAGYELAEAAGVNDIPYEGEFKIGVDAIVYMCAAPISLLAKTSSVILEEEGDYLLEPNAVIDFSTKEVGDALKMGIIDPYNVTISALHNAYSVAKTILLSSAAINNEQK